MKWFLLYILIICQLTSLIAQESSYENAYNEITSMLSDSESLNFKKAVYHTENAYYESDLNWYWFDNQIKQLTSLVQLVANVNKGNLLYEGTDSSDVLMYASLFKLFNDSVPIAISDSVMLTYLPPFKYDFYDVFGQKNWPNMFVSKLFTSRKGNCHSLSYLYKILSEELGLKSNIALAPLHMYIKSRCEKLGFYNTELTNGSFPSDAWIISSGYIHLDAIRNSLYMDTLNQKETVAICLFDLAKGYERKFGVGDGVFMLKCCDAVLSYFPNHVSSLILKSEVLLHQSAQLNADTIPKVKSGDSTVFVSETYVNIIAKLHRLGYRRMPKEMYLRWIGSGNESSEGLKLFTN